MNTSSIAATPVPTPAVKFPAGSTRAGTKDYRDVEYELANMSPDELRSMATAMVKRKLGQERPAELQVNILAPRGATKAAAASYTCCACGVPFRERTVPIVSCTERRHLFCQPCALRVSTDKHPCPACIAVSERPTGLKSIDGDDGISHTMPVRVITSMVDGGVRDLKAEVMVYNSSM